MAAKLNISFDKYRALEGINVTSIGEFLRSPMHYLYKYENPKDTKSMKVGRAFHELVLQPLEFEKNYFCIGDFGVPERMTKAEKERIERLACGREILSLEEVVKVRGMANAVKNSSSAMKLIDGEREVSTQFQINGHNCKARADVLLRDDFVVDLKSCVDASPEEFIRSIFSYKYYLQAPFYLKAFERTEFIFIAVESAPPYGIGFYQIPRAIIEYGMAQCEELVEAIAKSWEEKNFPGYSSQIQMIEVPSWMEHKIRSQHVRE